MLQSITEKFFARSCVVKFLFHPEPHTTAPRLTSQTTPPTSLGGSRAIGLRSSGAGWLHPGVTHPSCPGASSGVRTAVPSACGSSALLRVLGGCTARCTPAQATEAVAVGHTSVRPSLAYVGQQNVFQRIYLMPTFRTRTEAKQRPGCHARKCGYKDRNRICRPSQRPRERWLWAGNGNLERGTHILFATCLSTQTHVGQQNVFQRIYLMPAFKTRTEAKQRPGCRARKCGCKDRNRIFGHLSVPAARMKPQGFPQELKQKIGIIS